MTKIENAGRVKLQGEGSAPLTMASVVLIVETAGIVEGRKRFDDVAIRAPPSLRRARSRC